MNELKPEDVMRALECCDADNPNCGDCPCYENRDYCWNLNKLALALIREADALITDFQIHSNILEKRLAEKDAEIERLKAGFERLADESDARDIDDTYARQKIEAEAITEFEKRMEKALNAQVNVSSNEMLAAFMWCLDLVKNVEKQLKGEQK